MYGSMIVCQLCANWYFDSFVQIGDFRRYSYCYIKVVTSVKIVLVGFWYSLLCVSLMVYCLECALYLIVLLLLVVSDAMIVFDDVVVVMYIYYVSFGISLQ